MITTWYLQSQRTWDKLCHSCIGSSFLPRGAFPEGRAYAVSRRLHAGSLEALRVSRPEAVVLVGNNSVSQGRLPRVSRRPRNNAEPHAVPRPVARCLAPGEGSGRPLRHAQLSSE